MDDAALLAHCRAESFRGSGRGGQKRNVTDSAVRVTHLETGICASCDQSRSQIRNRSLALGLLRRQIALQWRVPPVTGWQAEPVPGRQSKEYALWTARLLDALEACGQAVGEAAGAVGVSTGKLVRLLSSDPQVWQQVNRDREGRGLKRLRCG
jgi:hypothetical protein